MEVNGKIHLIGETEEVGNNGFTKRLIVIATEEQYSQTIPIDFVKDKTSLLDNFKVGETVKVSINMRGNEYNGKYYVNLQGWRIEGMAGTQGSNPLPAEPFKPAESLNEEPQDDMPF
jgi:hypothetical protein